MESNNENTAEREFETRSIQTLSPVGTLLRTPSPKRQIHGERDTLDPPKDVDARMGERFPNYSKLNAQPILEGNPNP